MYVLECFKISLFSSNSIMKVACPCPVRGGRDQRFLQETRSTHDSMNIPKIEFISF